MNNREQAFYVKFMEMFIIVPSVEKLLKKIAANVLTKIINKILITIKTTLAFTVELLEIFLNK